MCQRSFFGCEPRCAQTNSIAVEMKLFVAFALNLPRNGTINGASRYRNVRIRSSPFFNGHARVPAKNNGDSILKTVIGLRWWMIALVCAGTIVDYLSRNAFGVMAAELKTLMNMSTQQ